MDPRFERAPVGILDVSPGGTVRSMNETAGELLEMNPERVAGEPVGTVIPDSVAARVPRAFETPPDSDTSFEEYYPEPDQWLAIDIVPGDDSVWVYLADTTAKHRRSQQLESLQSDLEQLTIGNEVIADILEELVAASTREEMTETLCQHLGETDSYEFAWVGERELGSDDITMRATAGTTGRTLQRIEEALAAGRTLPELRAVETGDPVIVQPLGEDSAVPERIRRAAFADGLQSHLAIPLTYGSSVYGVVGVYSAEQDAFSARERETFGTVGQMAGLAINATRNRSVLLSDTVVELTFQLQTAGSPFAAVATSQDATVTVNAVLPRADHLRCYVETSGSPATGVVAELDDHESVMETRTIAEHDDGGSLEVVAHEETPLGRLVSEGATVESAVFDSDNRRVVVDLPPEAEIRRIAEAVTREYGAAVVSKRERERDHRTADEFREALAARLTERQEDALRTAFAADYFESPRESSAEEVAEALGITGPTLLHHLRAGQRKLLEELFEKSDHR